MRYKVVIHTTVFVEAQSVEDAQEYALDQIENGIVDTCDVEEIDEEEQVFSGIWTVSIKDRLEPEMSIWTASFSTEKKADAFIEKVKERLKKYDALETTDVVKDKSYLDDEMYLDWIDDRWCEYEEDEDENTDCE